jgi:general secretion pathway protein E
VIDLPSSDMVHGQVYQAVGCPLCEHSGYAGRTLIEESLYVTAELRQRFIEDEIVRSEMPGKRFFQSLEDSARAALLSGVVDVKQIRKIIIPSI